MADYMLLLYDDNTAFDGLSPEAMQQIVARYGAWRDELAKRGQLAGGEKLTDGEGRVLRGSGDAMRVIDGPFSEAKEVIGGFFTVRAESYDQAVEIASACPHLDYGTVEIREIEAH